MTTSMPYVPVFKPIVSQTDQPQNVVPAVSSIVNYQSGSSVVERDGCLLGGEEGHVAIGCGGGGGAG